MLGGLSSTKETKIMPDGVRKRKAVVIGLGGLAVILTILPTAVFTILNWDLFGSML